ncbi:DUF58 domain-containing protein [Halosolutus amylolyticus]|uniref:DUF58 domain-containing protein n=1 Tax=Halosolutus amylolyticus TaxID=2932267 RepID=A0ABD5PPQ9_9EURY|nr:DUF58 domain-containing protein [Halosolutus amylolyticus]
MRRQRRWRGAIAATIVLVIAGLADGNGVLLLGGVVPLAYVAAGALSRVRPPDEDDLALSRSVTPTPAPPGRPVTVTLTVTNESDRTLPDLRIVDGVPRDLAVLQGSPRAGTTLEPGETIEIEYVVVARRGEYAFEPPHVRVRGLGASAVTTTAPEPAGDNSLVCRLDADAPPIEETGRTRIGQLTTDRPGEGIAFHSSREHQPDDPASRINWRQYAKRGELATVNYEQQVAATVILVVDARSPNHVVAGRGRPTGVELAVYAATRALSDLLAHGHDVGVAIVGLEGDGPAGLVWLEPRSGPEQRSRALESFRLATDATTPSEIRDRNPGESMTGSERYEADRAAEQHRKLIDLAPANAQVALFSPLLDDVPIGGVETWRGAGLPTVVLSPDIVPENTASGQHAQIRRRTRLARCQAAGARTFDWRRGTPLPLIIEQAFAADAKLAGRLGAGAGGSGGGSGRDSGPTTGPVGDPSAGGDD